MRNTVLLLFLLALAATPAAAQSANGIYQFTLGEDEFVKHVEFDARKQADGTTVGSVFLSDDAMISYQDVDGTGVRPETFKGVYLKADVDDLVVVNKNQAIMSGTVRDSSIFALVGLRVLLTVEDNGDNTRVPDRITWGVYKFEKRTWTPSDAEWKEDPGVGLRWWATDFERKGDVGYAMPRPEEPAGTQTFLASAYDYAAATRATGDIVVSP